MDLYKLQKISASNSKPFYIINQVFSKFSQIVFCTSAICCYKKSAALSAVSVNGIVNISKLPFLSSKCLFGFFPQLSYFSGLSHLLTGLELNGFCPDPLTGPRSRQRAPRWV